MMTTEAPWSREASTLLTPGGCLVVASGNASVDNPIELRISSVVEGKGLNTWFSASFDDITIVHSWGVDPNANVFGKAQPCTVPQYSSKADIQGIVLKPQSFFVSFGDKGDRLERSFVYTIGCSDLPVNPTNGGAYYVQVWGQSHTIRQSTDGPWMPSTEPYRFDKILASSKDNGFIFGRVDGSLSDAKPFNCSAKTTTKVVTTVKPRTATPATTRATTTTAPPTETPATTTTAAPTLVPTSSAASRPSGGKLWTVLAISAALLSACLP